MTEDLSQRVVQRLAEELREDLVSRLAQSESSSQRFRDELRQEMESRVAQAQRMAEEHQGVMVECKTSMASIQQILDAKDKIAAQLQNVQQQQREDDKQELLDQLQRGQEGLRGRLAEMEAAVAAERSARVEAQQQSEVHVSRLGVALEKAQSAWLKDADHASAELREVHRQLEKAAGSDEARA